MGYIGPTVHLLGDKANFIDRQPSEPQVTSASSVYEGHVPVPEEKGGLTSEDLERLIAGLMRLEQCWAGHISLRFLTLGRKGRPALSERVLPMLHPRQTAPVRAFT
jgi:hypothetical protein